MFASEIRLHFDEDVGEADDDRLPTINKAEHLAQLDRQDEQVLSKLDSFTSSGRRGLLKIALRKQIRRGRNAAAETIFGLRGLHPYWWGIGKEQFEEVVELVRQAMDRGDIKNQDDPSKPFYYDPAVFNDRSVTTAPRPLLTTVTTRPRLQPCRLQPPGTRAPTCTRSTRTS